MPDLTDLSGPFNPNLRLEDLSRDFLVKVLRIWQWSWLQLDAGWFEEVHKRFGLQPGYDCDLEMWLRCADRCNTRYARIANIPMTNAVDCLKALQLPLDNSMGAVYPTEHEIIDENHAIITVMKCPSLEWCERNAPERIAPMCQWMEPRLIERYKVNLDVRLTPTRLPPRQDPDDIACQWDYRLDVPEGTRVRGKDEVVDETTNPPEVDDLSGPFYPYLTHEKFSKAFLVKMMNAWQYAWLVMNEGYYFAVESRFGAEAANECELLAWMRVGERASHRYPKIANIQLDTVVDSLKALQLPMDNTMGLFPAEYEIRGPNHVVLTIKKGRTPDYLENAVPERTPPMYHDGGKPLMEKYLVNPRIKVSPLRLPPRNSNDDVDCQWELTIED